MKFGIVLVVTIIISFIHGFFVPVRVFPDNIFLQAIYALFSGFCIGSFGAHVLNSLESK